MGSGKAADNLAKHRVAFEMAATVLRDPLALSVFDSEHSETEERWATMGRAEDGRLLVVVHTFGNKRFERYCTHHLRPRSYPPRARELREPAAVAATGDRMKDEYDFRHGARGKFYRTGAKLALPVYLEDEVQSYLARRAAERGVELSELVNDLLRKDIELIESGK